MPSLFRRRPKEPPSTGNFNSIASRRRQPVDPPSSHAAVKTGPRDPDDILSNAQREPEIQLTGHQLELLNKKNSNQHFGTIPNPKDPSEAGAPALALSRPVGSFAAQGGDMKPGLVSDDDFLGDHWQTGIGSQFIPNSQNISSSSDNDNKNLSYTRAATGKTSTIAVRSDGTVEQRPFTTRSNTETAILSKTISTLAAKRAGKERRSISAARSSVFRHGNSTDNANATINNSGNSNKP